MSLAQRTISNTGDPLCSQTGQVLSGVAVKFTLVNNFGQPCGAWDTTSKILVAPYATIVTTDVNGQFSVSLWPNSRGDSTTYYLCEVNYPGVSSFLTQLADGSVTLDWYTFKHSGVLLTSNDMSALALHVQDGVVHITAAERILWNAGGSGSSVIIDYDTNGTPTGKLFKWITVNGFAELEEL